MKRFIFGAIVGSAFTFHFIFRSKVVRDALAVDTADRLNNYLFGKREEMPNIIDIEEKDNGPTEGI